MSLNLIESQINKFLKSSSPEVLSIKGAWGSGKTYTWNKLILEAKKKNEISLERYSYVSLFGINSLEILKYNIFENSVKRELIGTAATIESFRENTTGLLESFGKKTLGLFREGPFLKNFASAINSVSFLSIFKTIICIDDLERKGTALTPKDILGLISFLKEQRNCKVVLLLNDSEEGIEDYTKYKEKVVDIELKFAPSSTECASIAFTGNDKLYGYLRNLSQSLDIRNIRVLKKIETFALLIYPYIKNCETETVEQAVRSLTLLTWCYYSVSEETPTINILLDISNNPWSFDKKDKEDPKRENWRILLSDYGFTSITNFDLTLLEIIKSGYLEESVFKEIVEMKNKEVISSKFDKSHSDAWDLYHQSFDNNEVEVVTALYNSFKNNAQNIAPVNLNGLVTLFRNLDLHDKASELIDHYIKVRGSKVELFNLYGDYSFGDINDEEIKQKFSNFYKESISKENIEAVSVRLNNRGSLRSEDELILANASVDDYYRIFKSQKASNLPLFVRECLRFSRYSNASEDQHKISTRAKEALKRIAKESKMNLLRVRKYGISVED
ncbi:P-loop NTPase fold protein [Leptospira kmetyi]|uniref:P-loop NTPase fold protein n=1 Tax=Leptospira kmetyi TaxID=408139 RepID=UPI00108442B0|nr:P-loop NTPase fold protein [Leptospira kmetyi]TGL73139.1 hypothetical protein EHQ67_00025 [Leptospira kmetyi]